MTLEEYLQKIGLPQYNTSFEDNDIDLDTLKLLSDADLQQVGIHSFGHRKKILGSIHQSIQETKTLSTLEQENDRIENEERQVHQEKVFLNEANYFISTHRVELEKTTYPLANISSVHLCLHDLNGDIEWFTPFITERLNLNLSNSTLPLSFAKMGSKAIKKRLLIEEINTLPFDQIQSIFMDYQEAFQVYSSKLTAIYLEKDHREKTLAIVLLVIGLILRMVSSGTFGTPTVLWIIGFTCQGIGAFWYVFLLFTSKLRDPEPIVPIFSVRLGTAGGEKDGLVSEDIEIILKISKAINNALSD